MATVNTFSWPVRVYYEDTDAGGVVYHSQYLNFMERARTEWLRHLGFEQTQLKDEFGVIIVIHSLSITFKSPAIFNDLLSIKSDLVGLGRCNIDLKQVIIRDSIVLAEAQVKGIFVNSASFKPVSIPQPMKQAMEKL